MRAHSEKRNLRQQEAVIHTSAYMVPVRQDFGLKVTAALAWSLVGFVFLFLGHVLTSRLLGPGGKGTFSLFNATVGMIVIISTLGIGDGQIFLSQRDRGLLRHFIPNGYAAAIIGGALGALSFYVALAFDAVHLPPFQDRVLVAGMAAVFISTILIYQRQFFLAIHRYSAAKAMGALLQGMPLLAYGVLYIANRITVANVILAYVVSQLCSCAVFHGLVTRAGPSPRTLSLSFAKEAVRFGIGKFLSELTQYLAGRIDFILIAWLAGASALGIYSVAVALAETTCRLVQEFGTLLFPAFASGDLSRPFSIALLRKSVFVTSIGTGLLALTCRPVVTLVFGSQFVGSVTAFQLLLPGTLAWSTIYVTFNHASGTGSPGSGIPIFALAALVDAVLDLFLIPRWGVAGASIAASVSYWVAAVLFLQRFCAKLECSFCEVLIVRRADLISLRDLTVRIPPMLWRAIFIRSTSAIGENG